MQRGYWFLLGLDHFISNQGLNGLNQPIYAYSTRISEEVEWKSVDLMKKYIFLLHKN